MLEGVLFLGGHTARSKAYVQAMANAGLSPQWAVFYGEEGSARPGQEGGSGTVELSQSSAIFYPDLEQPALQTVTKAGWNCRSSSAAGVNADELVSSLREISPRLIVFCGYGGEIVRLPALSVAPFLHIHSGWLPDYRGSTTGYYSLIEEGSLGASAIILDQRIDTGDMVMRRRYPPPPPGIDMDYIYDPAIRADLLIRVLRHVAATGELPPSTVQPKGGRTFYVIHPVLKHLALLGLRSSKGAADGQQRQV